MAEQIGHVQHEQLAAIRKRMTERRISRIYMMGMAGGLEQANTTCEALFAEVARLQTALRHVSYDEACHGEIFGLEQRIAELELENAAMREIVQAVITEYADDGHTGAIACKWCGTWLEHGMASPPDQHPPECVVTKARAIRR